MHTIYLAHARDAQILDRIEAEIRPVFVDMLPFHPHRIRVWRGRNTLLLSAEAVNPVFREGSVSMGQGAFAFTGAPLVTELAQQKGRYGADDIAAYFRRVGPRGFYNTAASSYAVADVHDDRMAVLGDFCGRYPWFYRKQEDVICVSSLPRLLAEPPKQTKTGLFSFFKKPSAPELDQRAATSLTVHSQLWGDHTLFKDVRLLEPGKALVVDENGIRFAPLDEDWFWFDEGMPPSWQAYEEASQDLVESFKVLKTLVNEPITLGLSGGKDSRVMAAYAAAAGFGDQLKTITGGMEGSPEFDIADRVREVLSITGTNYPSAPAGMTVDSQWSQLHTHIGRHDGQLLPTAGFRMAHNSPPNVEVSGYGGEAYRRGIAKQFVSKPITGEQDARERWRSYHVPPDANGIIRDEIVARDAEWMSDWVSEQVKAGYPLQSLPELFFARYRVPLHQGLVTAHSAIRLYVDPLIHQSLRRTHFRIGRFAGETELTHCSLLWHVKPELCNVQFVKDKWDPRLLPLFPEGALTQDPYAEGLSDRHIRPQAWNFFLEADREIRAIFEKQTALYDYVDRAKLFEVLKTYGSDASSAAKSNQMFTVLGLQLHLLGMGERPKDGIPGPVDIRSSGAKENWLDCAA